MRAGICRTFLDLLAVRDIVDILVLVIISDYVLMFREHDEIEDRVDRSKDQALDCHKVCCISEAYLLMDESA